MLEIARRPERDRADLFRAASQEMGINESIVEKDFWVCWTLDYLFRESPWRSQLAFKGGTSLSKAYGLIERFSEDIDLIIDWTLLGYKADEPWADRSATKQDGFNKAANQRAVKFLADSFIPELRRSFAERLKGEAAVETVGQDVLFHYPAAFSSDYISPTIKLEMGPLAAWVPNEDREIRPYAEQRFPNLFSRPSAMVRTVVAERSFWEKATILHQESHRRPDQQLPLRYSRHYYDLYIMSLSPVKDKALANLALLRDVVEFKKRFYHCPWACYDDARPGSLMLLPPQHHEADLLADYRAMRSMLFREGPAFEKILEGMAELEKEINAL